MDAVELPYPVDVAALKLKKGESDLVSILPTAPPIERCSSYLNKRDATAFIDGAASLSWGKISDAELCKDDSQLSSFHNESQNHENGGNSFLLFTSKPSDPQLQRKAGKVPRSSNLCPKRPRVAQVENHISLAGLDDVKDMVDKLGSHHKKCASSDKVSLVKQRNSTGRRGDKKNTKASMKTKYDSFSLKTGSGSFNAAAYGGNIYGVYGLKSEFQEMAQLVDDPPLNTLLDGTYVCHHWTKENAKKEANMNDNLLLCVRKAFSTLQISKPIHPQNITDTDSSSIKKMTSSPASSMSIAANGINCDKVESCMTDVSSCDKSNDSSTKSDTLANSLDFLISKPEDIFKQLALPPCKDLESLLNEATKQSLPSRNTTDLRPGKQLSRRTSLPPFQWSHSFNGHFKTSSESAKLSASRSSCPGRWLQIQNDASSLGILTDCFTNLESMTFDQSVIPSGLKTKRVENEISLSGSVINPQLERDSLPSASCLKASVVTLVTEGKACFQGNDVHCPRAIAAAQTLCDISTQPSRQSPDGMIRWPKKPSQKAMKARKLKSNEKPEDIIYTPVSLLVSDNHVKSTRRVNPSKKTKLITIMENKKDQINFRKEAMNWSAPRSNRSLHNKFRRDSVLDARYLMPPPVRMLAKGCESQQQNRRKSTGLGKEKTVRNGFESEAFSL